MELVDTAIEAARAAGYEIVRRLPQERDVRSKGFRDIVTDADLAAQDILVSIIRSRFPQHGILSEEGLRPGGDVDTLWVLDPLDGTTNYARRFPCFAVSIGVVRKGMPVAGVVFAPLQDHLFCAEQGSGATLNSQPLAVSPTIDLAEAVVGLDFARAPSIRDELMADIVTCSRSIHTFRSTGSAALGLCYVAAGWLEAYLHLGLAPWDCAAGGLIVLEAGGMVTDTAGGPWSYTSPRCLATNGKLHTAFVNLLHSAQGAHGE